MKLIDKIFSLFTILVFSSLSSANAVPVSVGDQSCKPCHLEEYQQWLGSHHDLAMQEANNKTVLGNFNTTIFTKEGTTAGQKTVTTTFFKENGRFMVNTDGPDGKLHDYEISYTFGVYPLQQYMVKFPQGKIQVLDIAWDSRTKDEGGQRWFSLHPNEYIDADDVLHWTGPNLNWNYMCADCHSTNLKKNYNESDKSFNTQWDVINVSCEACHGPASEHIKWAQAPENKNSKHPDGLTIDLSVATNHRWKINDKTGKPELSGPLSVKEQSTEVELCAKCHSRRSQLDDNFIPGDNFRDHYLPSLLTETLYYPDGKIKEEVYVYGSFKQSRMYEAGVTCSDCHNPHTLELKANGHNVCMICHLTTKYATPKHHFHKYDSDGASCISCHMPAKIYMGVDVRNDHSFRIPRPDLAEQLSMPDACTNCHDNQDSQWSADVIKKWYGNTPEGYQQFGPALHSLDIQSEDALTHAYELFLGDTPNIAKATAIGHLGDYPSRQTLMTSQQMLRSKDADIRRQALRALQSFPIQHTGKQIFSMLKDPVKIVRLEAASILAAVPQGAMEKEQQDLIDKVTEEYRQSLLFIAERPEGQLSLAQLYSQMGKADKAETAYKEALALQSKFIPAYVNYANFMQQQNNETAAFELLQAGLKIVDDAALYHSLGLWYVRNNDKAKGIIALQKATELEPDHVRYQYVYAVAVGEKQPEKAIKILESSLVKHSGNLDILSALSGYYKQIGDNANAVKYYQKAKKVLRVVPK